MALVHRVRVTASITPELLKKLDDYAAQKGLNRNAAINAAIATVLQQDQAMNIMPDLLKAYAELKDKQND